MIDFTTVEDNRDVERFEKTMQSTRTAGVKNLYLATKGIPKQPYYDALENEEDFISPGNNVLGSLFRSYGGVEPSISFRGFWRSNSSQVLVNFDFDDLGWAN